MEHELIACRSEKKSLLRSGSRRQEKAEMWLHNFLVTTVTGSRMRVSAADRARRTTTVAIMILQSLKGDSRRDNTART